MLDIIEFERDMIGAGIFGIIIGKFCYWHEQSCLIVLLSINKCSEVRFYCGVLSLSLAIYLMIKGCK